MFIHGGHVDCRETIFQKGLDQNKFCFITPSRPGYGNTPLTCFNGTARGAADLFVALLDKLKLDKVIVIGISAGGLTALEMAANYPERVESLVLMSALTKKWYNKTNKVYKGGKKIFAPKVERYTWLICRYFFKIFPKLMTAVLFKALSKYQPVMYTRNEFEEIKEIILSMSSGSGFSNDLDQSIEQDTLSHIKCQTLILHSDYDNSVDSSHPQNAKEKINHSRLVTFKNRWGHMLWVGEDYEPVLIELKRQIE